MTLSRASRLVLESVDERVVPAPVGPALDYPTVPLFTAALVRHDSVTLADLADRPTLPPAVQVLATSAPPSRAALGAARLEPDALQVKVDQLTAISDLRILLSPPDRLFTAGNGASPLSPPYADGPGEVPVPFEMLARHLLLRFRDGPGLLAPDAEEQTQTPSWAAPVAAVGEPVQQPVTEAPSQTDAVREASANLTLVVVSDSGHSVEPVTDPAPAVELVVPPAERPRSVEVVEETPVEAPALDPLFGLLPVDVSAVECEARALLDHVAALQVVDVTEWLGTERYAWLAGVAAATGGTAQAIRIYRTRGRAAHDAPSTHFVLGRLEGDVGTDR